MAFKEFHVDNGTLFGLAVALTIMPAAYFFGKGVLPRHTPRKYQVLFFWHAYDFLTHFILEGAFLYHSFFSFVESEHFYRGSAGPGYLRGPDDVAYLWNNPKRRYGSTFSRHFTALPWIEYGKADVRWLYADLNVVSLELLTVLLGGPCATYICYQIYRAMSTTNTENKGRHLSKIWFAATVLATGELYGGFMTFAPEWLSGSQMLNTADPVYLWFYLVFFNMLWVVFPLWVLYCAWGEVSAAIQERTVAPKKMQ